MLGRLTPLPIALIGTSCGFIRGILSIGSYGPTTNRRESTHRGLRHVRVAAAVCIDTKSIAIFSPQTRGFNKITIHRLRKSPEKAELLPKSSDPNTGMRIWVNIYHVHVCVKTSSLRLIIEAFATLWFGKSCHERFRYPPEQPCSRLHTVPLPGFSNKVQPVTPLCLAHHREA
jgi:hypothetical protein